jgi:tetratricopeptide (TPR) repeat protein
MAYTLNFLGLTNLSWMERKPYLEEAMAVFKDINDQRGVVLSMRSLGWVAFKQGDYLKAKLTFEEGLSLCREMGYQEGTANYINSLGYLASMLGNYEEAKNLHQECIGIYRDISVPISMADAINNLAIAASGLKDYEEAKRLFQDCLAIYKEIGVTSSIAVTLTNLGEIAIAMGEYDNAIHFAQESWQFYKKVDEQERSPELSWYFRVLGEASFGLKQYQRAKKYLYQALDSAVINLSNYYILLSFVGIAQLLAIEGEKERSLELLTLVLHHPASWQWTKDKALRILPEIESGVPPDITEAAKKRGMERDLQKTAEELLVDLGK